MTAATLSSTPAAAHPTRGQLTAWGARRTLVQQDSKDYVKAGDSLTIDVNAATDVISGVTVATFTDSAKDAVGLNVTFGSLPDGTVYAVAINLSVAAQNLAVAIENTGHKKAGS